MKLDSQEEKRNLTLVICDIIDYYFPHGKLRKSKSAIDQGETKTCYDLHHVCDVIYAKDLKSAINLEPTIELSPIYIYDFYSFKQKWLL